MRGHRQGIRQAKGKENRAHRTVTVKSNPKVTEGTRVSERGRAHADDTEVYVKKKWKTPTYDEHMRERQVTADTPLRKGQSRMSVGPVVDTT